MVGSAGVICQLSLTTNMEYRMITIKAQKFIAIIPAQSLLGPVMQQLQ
jgi:hypothetical protein